MRPADCNQRPDAHYRRCALLLPSLLLLAGCFGSTQVAEAPRPAAGRHEWPVVAPADPIKANAVLIRAISLVGKPYKWGGNTPEGGFDCSGLVGYVYRDMLDMRLPRTTSELIKLQGPRIQPGQLASGDLVFFGSNGKVSHVGIYVGEGRFVHAPSTGGTVRLDRLDDTWWRDHYSGARRLLF